jgi:hypothetical protein
MSLILAGSISLDKTFERKIILSLLIILQTGQKRDQVVEFYEGDGTVTRVREKYEPNPDMGDI